MEILKIAIFAFVVVFQFALLQATKANDKKIDHKDQLVVKIPNGKLRGSFKKFYYAYLSIPYAMPPVGDLRFESPRPYNIKWKEIYNATRPPTICMQWDQFNFANNPDLLGGEEDCLMLHIYKPVVNHNAKLPVIVFIHGGGFTFGTVNAANHERIMERGNFIVVKISYRLGPLGFLSTEDNIIPGNYGLKDQRLALRWIKSNIASFGGDPGRILITGFSAGGASAHLHVLRKDFANDAKAVISFSGTAFNPWVIMRNSRKRAMTMARNLKCPIWNDSVEIKRCLKSKNASEIVRNVQKFQVFGFSPFTIFGPVVEVNAVADAFLTQHPEAIIRSGKFSHIPWMTAYTAQDGGYNAAELLKILPGGGEMIDKLNDRWFDVAPYALYYKDTIASAKKINAYSASIKRRYLGNREFSIDTYLDVQRMYTDILFKIPAEKAVRLHKRYSKSPVYAYVYDNPTEQISGSVAKGLSQRNDFPFGTTHGDDFILFFPFTRTPPDASEKKLFNNFIKMLEDFVNKGDKLTYTNCKFVNNVGQKKLQLMSIMKNSCENLSVKHFP